MKEFKPTVEEIKNQLIPKSKELYQDVREKFTLDEKYYELDFKNELNLPEDFADEGIVLPTGRDVVDTYVDHIDISNIRISVNKKGTSNISAEEEEMMRKFFLGIAYRTNIEADISPWRVAGKHHGLHGLCVFKVVWDADKWMDKPAMKEDENEVRYAERIEEWQQYQGEDLPIVLQSVNPFNVIPDPSYGGRGFVTEEREYLCFDAKNRFPHWTNPKNKKLDTKVTLQSFWTPTYRCELLDGVPILRIKGGVVKHNYGFLNYTFIDSGLGNLSAKNEASKRYVGILRYIFDLLVSESRNYSTSDIVLKKAGFPWLTISGDNAKLVTEISQKYGMANKLPEGVKIEEMVSKVPPDALNAHLYRTSDYIAAHAAPRSVRGLSETGVRSGADRRLVIAEAAAKYKYSSEAFRYGASKVLINCAKLVKNVIPGNIRLWARTPTGGFDIEIDKKKMKEPFTCYVEFAPISDEDEYRRHDDLERLVAGGITTRQWARTQMPNVDPLEMELEEEVEKLRNDENLHNIAVQYVGGKLSEAISKRSAVENIKGGGKPQQETPEAGRRLVPPIREAAIPGSAEGLQNEMANLRSQTPMNANQGRGGGGNRP